MRKVDYAPKTCGICGQTFERPINQRGATWAARVYCSRGCVVEARRRKAYDKRPVHTCPICKEEFRSSHPNHVTCRKPECKDRYKVEVAGRKQSQTIKEQYANGRLPAAGISPRELALREPLTAAGWKWRTVWFEAFGKRFEMDFCHFELKLNFEIDGQEHRYPKRMAIDAERDAELIRRGWRVLRIPNADVDTSPQDVLARVLSWSSS